MAKKKRKFKFISKESLFSAGQLALRYPVHSTTSAQEDKKKVHIVAKTRM
jgi:hypothetical protein